MIHVWGWFETLRRRWPEPPAGRFWWLATVAWMGVIFWFSSRSDSGKQSGYLMHLLAWTFGAKGQGTDYVDWHHLLRKAGHFTEFGVLGVLLLLALGRSRPRAAALAVVFATAYATTDELHQMFVPNRGPSPWDVGIDALGAFTAIALVKWWWARRNARR